MRLLVTLLLLAPLSVFADGCKKIRLINADAYSFKNDTRSITFIAMDLKNKTCHVINKKGLNHRHGPYSTFKIPHTLIALETGAVKSIDELIEWDQVKYPAKKFWPETWRKSQTLGSAFEHSAVWYYQDLVPRIDPKQYKEWLSAFRYGNQTFTPGSNNFWLNSELKISPAEQVNFIACLLKNRCGVKASSFSAFESAALQETKKGFSLYAKAGTGPLDENNFDGAFEGWYVGYIKDHRGNPLAAFAIYLQADSFSSLQKYRKELSLKLLTDLGYWKP